jgi:putative Holliday junction resolvase
VPQTRWTNSTRAAGFAERLSEVSAQAAVRSSGESTKETRSVIDQVAAVMLLQHALDFERSSERSPGVVVDPDKGLQQ